MGFVWLQMPFCFNNICMVLKALIPAKPHKWDNASKYLSFSICQWPPCITHWVRVLALHWKDLKTTAREPYRTKLWFALSTKFLSFTTVCFKYDLFAHPNMWQAFTWNNVYFDCVSTAEEISHIWWNFMCTWWQPIFLQFFDKITYFWWKISCQPE